MTNFSKKLGKIAENTSAYLDALATKNSDTPASDLVGPYALMEILSEFSIAPGPR